MGAHYSSPKLFKTTSAKGSMSNLNEILISELDIYLIKQIAKNLKQFDLEQKIDLEIKMQEGTTKLLAACRHEIQSLEASKSLFTSNQRMSEYMNELQRRKAEERAQIIPKTKINGSKAKVSVSDIRLPLIWKDSDHFKNKGDYRRFSVFCLLKIGTEIYDTIFLHNIDRSMTDISFDDIVVFHDVPPNFEFTLEVYSRMMQDDLSIASTPRKLKKKISSSVSRTFGRKLAASIKNEFSDIHCTKFDLMAKAKLKLEQAEEAVCTYDLVIESNENRQSQLPLFGMFCCRFAVQPDCHFEEKISGYLRHEVENKISMYWSSLKSFSLFLWDKESIASEDINYETYQTLPPDITIPINRFTKIEKLEDGLSFIIINEENQSNKFSVINSEDYSLWILQIGQHINDHKIWKKAAEKVMDIPNPLSNRRSMTSTQRIPGSLYEMTPLLDTPRCRINSSYIENSKPEMRVKNIKLDGLKSSPSLETNSSSTINGANQKWASYNYMSQDFYKPVSIAKCSPLHDSFF